MNALATSYIPDKTAAFQIKVCGWWSYSCLLRHLADADDAFEAFKPRGRHHRPDPPTHIRLERP